jgi:proline iminopeptidase
MIVGSILVGYRHPEDLGHHGSPGEITVPTLPVGGRYDECTPGHLADTHSRIPGSRLAIIEDASHLCFAEQPAQFNGIINAFFDGTDPGSST